MESVLIFAIAIQHPYAPDNKEENAYNCSSFDQSNYLLKLMCPPIPPVQCSCCEGWSTFKSTA